MEVHRHRTSVEADGAEAVEAVLRPTARGFTWRVANTSAAPVAVESVTAVCTLGGPTGRLRMLRNGWQSTSECSVAEVGADVDPASVRGAAAAEVSRHHPDLLPARPGGPGRADRLRSELVTVLADDRSAVLAAFLGGDLHDGTLWVGHGPTGRELRVEAHLGGVVLAPGEERDLHEVWLGEVDGPDDALGEWATEFGRRSLARIRGPRPVGWSSSRHYGASVRELDVRENLAAVGSWPLEYFEVGDGYQAAVGDWLSTCDGFPSGLPALAAAVAAGGCRAGLWLAPFLVAPGSRLATEHPDWLVHGTDGDLLTPMYMAHWGGFVHVLDVTRPDVQDHLVHVARSLVEMGFALLRVDHLVVAARRAAWTDRRLTPAERVRAGLDALRRGVGESTVLAATGSPLGPAVGVVDAMRVCPEPAPWWMPRRDLWDLPGYMGTVPSGLNAWRNLALRAAMHRRFFLNDTGCVSLGGPGQGADRADAETRDRAMLVAATGAVASVSDDLSVLDDSARALLSEMTELATTMDAAALDGAGPLCPDLLGADVPGRIVAGGVQASVDTATGSVDVVRG